MMPTPWDAKKNFIEIENRALPLAPLRRTSTTP